MARRAPSVGARDGIDWQIDDRQVRKVLRTMHDQVNDFRKYWEPIIDVINETNAHRFDTRDGGSWRPITSEKYERWKYRHNGGQTLVLSGVLRRVMTDKTSYGQNITRGRDKLTIRYFRGPGGGEASGANIAMVHQRGLHKGLPIRKVINPDEPVLRKAMGDALSQVARDWEREWASGR